ncbi:MAG: VOC family protein [Phycisphaerales bacterium JB060]
MMPALLETILYTPHPLRCAAFYQSLLGLRPIGTPDEHMAALRVDERSVLLLFDPEYASQPGRPVPSHGARGPGHVAFLVDDLDAWPARLAQHGVDIEREVTWPVEFFRAGRSIYFRDPAGNSVEVMDTDIWPP